MSKETNKENDGSLDARVTIVRRSEYNAWITWEGEGGTALELGEIRVVEDDEFAYAQTCA